MPRNLVFTSMIVPLLATVLGTGTARAQFVGGDEGNQFGASAGTNGTAAGSQSTASGTSSSAYGSLSTASAINASAFGNRASAGDSASAFGNFSTASGTYSSAYGNFSTASGFSSSAYGDSSTADFDFSTALGWGATVTRAHQMVLGTTNETYTTPGIDSAASRAVQGPVTSLVTTDAGGNLAGRSISSLGLATQDDISQNTTGIAGAMALSRIPTTLPRCQTYAASIGWGSFGGENAMALGGTAALSDNIFVSGGGSFGVGGRQSNGGASAGVTFAY